jgi:acetyl-CoA carboxylase carboxyl transferase subunit alpha
VASPEACASIVWRGSEKAPEAAEAMKVGASDLKKINIVDEIIPEPVGGAHQDYDAISANIKSSLLTNIAELSKFSEEELLTRRYQRLLKIGA